MKTTFIVAAAVLLAKIACAQPDEPAPDKSQQAQTEKQTPKPARPASIDPRLLAAGRGLKDSSWDAQLRSIQELKQDWGPRATPLLPDICTVACTRNLKTRQAVAELIEAIDPELYDAIVPVLVDQDPTQRHKALQALPAARNGKAAVPLVVWLARQNLAIAGTRSDTYSVGNYEARQCLRTAVELDGSDRSVIDLIHDVVSGRIRNSDAVSVAVLLMPKLSREKPFGQKSVDLLVDLLKKMPRNSPHATGPIKALEEFGPEARSALPVLRAAKLSSQVSVRQAAENAIVAIEQTP
jgi:hypothetical protein